MTVETRLENLERDFQECKQDVGLKMLTLERDSIERLTRLEVGTANISEQIHTFVSQHQFAPVKLIAYGLAAGVMTTVLGAIMAKLFIQ